MGLPAGGHQGRPYYLEEALVLFLLALDAVTCPRNRFQAFYLNLSLAGHTQAVGAILDACQGFVDQLQDTPVLIALVEKELLGVGVGGLVGNILGRFFVRFTPVALGLRHHPQQLLLRSDEALLVVFRFLLVHVQPFRRRRGYKDKILGGRGRTVKHEHFAVRIEGSRQGEFTQEERNAGNIQNH